MVNIPEVWSTYQKYAQHTAKKEKVKYLDKRYKKKRSSYRLSRANGVSHGVLDGLVGLPGKNCVNDLSDV